MKRAYLEVTFRKGRPIAAYLYFPRPSGARSARTVEVRPHLLVDYTADGTPLGLELVAPELIQLAEVNEVLSALGLQKLEREDLAPLKAA